MRIFVLIKQVPNTTKVKIDPRTGSLIRAGVEAIMNPEDRHALEAAVSLKEASRGRAKVIALSMGPPQAVDVLAEALGCGADEGVLLTDQLFAGADTWATSTTLAQAIRVLGGADLVLAGRQAIDGDTAQIGPQVAEALGLTQVTYVQGLELNEGKLIVTRLIEGNRERLEVRPPALLSVLARLNQPRHPLVGELLAACEPAARIKILNAADLGLKADEVGLAGSLTEVIQTFSPKQARRGEILEGSPAKMAAQLVARLKEAKVWRGGA